MIIQILLVYAYILRILKIKVCGFSIILSLNIEYNMSDRGLTLYIELIYTYYSSLYDQLVRNEYFPKTKIFLFFIKSSTIIQYDNRLYLDISGKYIWVYSVTPSTHLNSNKIVYIRSKKINLYEFIYELINQSTDQSINWSINQLINRSTDQSINWSINNWSIDQLNNWSTDQSINWSINRTIDKLINQSNNRSAEQLISLPSCLFRLPPFLLTPLSTNIIG